MEKKFQSRVALVTGGASGIGKVTAQVFAREGAKVIVSTDLVIISQNRHLNIHNLPVIILTFIRKYNNIFNKH